MKKQTTTEKLRSYFAIKILRRIASPYALRRNTEL
jgi:hypothetical protein